MSLKNGKNKYCLVCGRCFYVCKSKFRVKFCSYECYWKDKKNSSVGINNSFFGKKHSKLTREKMSGSNHHNWKGGVSKHPEGYVYILSKNHPRKNAHGYVYEHILVIEKSIGRYLKFGEVVHHINGIKSDNRLKNLKLFKSNAEHIRHHHENSI